MTRAPGVPAAPPGGLSFREFLTTFVRVPDEHTRRLVPLVLHPAEQAFVQAVDTRDSITGLRTYREFALSWPKKAGKSTALGALAVWGLVADGLGGPDREAIIVASDYLQARDVVFATAAKIVARHPWLKAHCSVSASEIVYEDTTAGYVQRHILKAVPARDVRGLHGTNHSMLLCDETWVHNDYGILEALAPSPARQSPITCFASYAGLKSQQHRGNPWYDILQRAHAGDPSLFLSELTGPQAHDDIPWASRHTKRGAAWQAQMARLYETCPAKRDRLVYNLVTAGDDSLISPEELAAALDATLEEPERGAPGQRYLLGVDLGLNCDWSAVVLTHQGSDGGIVVDLVRWWRGTKAKPVDLADVEAAILDLADRFTLSAITMDAWQAALMASHLEKAGLPVRTVQLTAAKVDQVISVVKRSFSRRQIKLPARCTELVEQLESVEAVESGRRGLVKFTPSGQGSSAAVHDDLAMALALSLDPIADTIGRLTLPPQRDCWKAVNGQAQRCFLFSPHGSYPSDPFCSQTCASLRVVMEQWRAAGGPANLPEWYRVRFAGNQMTEKMAMREAMARAAQIEI